MKKTLSTAMKTKYREKKLYFENGIFHREDGKELLNYYLYDIANGLDLENPSLGYIISKLFAARDQIHLIIDNNSYFLSLCEAFMIAHPDSIDKMISLLQAKGIHNYKMGHEPIRTGHYSTIATYIKEWGKGLKEKECIIDTRTPSHISHTWKALDEVCYTLEDRFRSFSIQDDWNYISGVEGFRQLFTGGSYKEKSFSTLELRSFGDRPTKFVELSGSVHIRYGHSKKDFYQYIKEEYQLYDSCRDYLAFLYRYTESIMREKLKAPKKKCDIQTILKKKYSRAGKEEKQYISMLKKYIQDARFEEGVRKGIDTYLSMHPEILPVPKSEKKPTKKKTKKLSVKEQMDLLDHGKNQEIRPVQKQKLSTVKSEADDVLSLLSLDEIIYHQKGQ